MKSFTTFLTQIGARPVAKITIQKDFLVMMFPSGKKSFKTIYAAKSPMMMKKTITAPILLTAVMNEIR